MADIFFPFIVLQKVLGDRNAMVRGQKTLAAVIVLPTSPATFKSFTIVCTSGNSGMFLVCGLLFLVSCP
jgi:hypothetical protein